MNKKKIFILMITISFATVLLVNQPGVEGQFGPTGWVPYTPDDMGFLPIEYSLEEGITSPEHISFSENIVEGENMEIKCIVGFPNSAYRVKDWGEIRVKDNLVIADAKLEEGENMFALMTVETRSHTYSIEAPSVPLWGGDYEDYTFIFNSWGEEVARKRFTVDKSSTGYALDLLLFLALPIILFIPMIALERWT